MSGQYITMQRISKNRTNSYPNDGWILRARTLRRQVSLSRLGRGAASVASMLSYTSSLSRRRSKPSRPLANFRVSTTSSFAYMEMSLILTKLLFTYDMDLLDKGLDWEGQSHVHVQWWKPELKVRFTEHKKSEAPLS